MTKGCSLLIQNHSAWHTGHTNSPILTDPLTGRVWSSVLDLVKAFVESACDGLLGVLVAPPSMLIESNDTTDTTHLPFSPDAQHARKHPEW